MIPGFRTPVGSSTDLERVLALPRRPPLDPTSPRADALVELMTQRLGLGPRECSCLTLGRSYCVARLLPVQAWALWEAAQADGVLAAVGVGAGKTILNILSAMVVPNVKTAVLLLPPGLVGQLLVEYDAVAQHFRVPSLVLPDARAGRLVPGAPVVHVLPYSRLQRPESSAYLEGLAPDLIVADEVHSLKNRSAARTARVLRYFCRGGVRFCGWSGTVASRSLLDFWHLSAFALGENSPAPLDADVAEQWAAAIDPSDWPADPGSLRKFAQSGEKIVEAYGRRVRESFGFVSWSGTVSDVGASNRLVERRTELPSSIRELRTEVKKTWVRPDGEELVEAPQLIACLTQLAFGFYYRWRFPGSPSIALVESWFAARKAWGREMREKLKRPEVHLDSPRLLANAAERYEAGYSGDLPTWQSEAWSAWRDIKDKVPHVTEAVWVDESVAEDAAGWAHKHRGVVWYEHRAFGEKVARVGDLPLHGGGTDAEVRILAEDGSRSIVASMSSHGEGRDGLQRRFAEQLITISPSSGKEWEQLLGRLHRRGQEADEVVTHVYRHVPELRTSLDKALRLAKFVEGLLTAEQRLLAANVEWDLNQGGDDYGA